MDDVGGSLKQGDTFIIIYPTDCIFCIFVLRNRPHELSSSMPPLRKWPMPHWCTVASESFWSYKAQQSKCHQIELTCITCLRKKRYCFRTYAIYLKNWYQHYVALPSKNQSQKCWSNPFQRPFEEFWACHSYNHGLPFASAHLQVSLVNPKEPTSSTEKQCNAIWVYNLNCQNWWRYNMSSLMEV